MRKRILASLIAVLLLVSLVPAFATAKAPAKAPAPTLAPTGGDDVSIMGSSAPPGTPGTWYIGATPPNVDYSKPVLLFVHGYNSSAQTWWTETGYHGMNDMYQYAYNNGYRTAFVDLHHDRSMWVNGELLNQLIDQIRSHFGVSKVTIIAHSKGGVDSNAASVHYGASGKISRVITLGSPHWGTPLADMAFSSWTWWLAAIFGQANEATYVLQTGYMDWYRSTTPQDTRPYYTFSGYKCGPVFSALWYGCMAIGGEDDGVVPVWSARIPGGTHLKEGYWDHDEIKMGSRTWSYFAPYIRTASREGVVAEGALLAAAPGQATDAGRGARPEAPGNLILRGGEVNGQAAAPPFAVESGVRSTVFTVYASSADFVGTLTSPDGQTYTVKTSTQLPAGEIFAGAYVGHVEVTKPAAGSWTLNAASSSRAGYLMIASLDSDLKATLDVGQGVSLPGGKRDLAVGFAEGRAVKESKAEAVLSISGQQAHGRHALTASGKAHRATVALPNEEGIHNVTVNVTGVTADGSAFERTLVGSFATLPLRKP